MQDIYFPKFCASLKLKADITRGWGKITGRCYQLLRCESLKDKNMNSLTETLVEITRQNFLFCFGLVWFSAIPLQTHHQPQSLSWKPTFSLEVHSSFGCITFCQKQPSAYCNLGMSRLCQDFCKLLSFSFTLVPLCKQFSLVLASSENFSSGAKKH